MTYIKPYVAKYGKSSDLIQGDCGWGVENFTLDKTGAKNKRVYVGYFRISSTCINMLCTDVYERGCEWQTRCNGSSNC